MPPRPKQVPETAPEPAGEDPWEDELEGEPGPPPRPRTPGKRQVDVTAVLVAHDGAQWLPEAVAALGASYGVPRHLVFVDTGSTDGSAELLEQLLAEHLPAHDSAVLRLPRTTGYGEAVAAGLATLDDRGERTCWLWLLHDDAAVDPGALTALIEEAERSPSAALLGPKARDWDDPRVLVEIGLTTDRAGHRETGLERREYDQGQHDTVRDVLAVGTAGALVRRDVWDRVGGLDPELPVFRDDLDLGWKVNAAGHRVLVVPEARIRHARAATTGRREADAAPGRLTGVDRRNALYVLLAHSSGLGALPLAVRLVLATALRSAGLLLTRQLVAAADEWRALAAVLRRPAVIAAARSRRAAIRTVPRRQLRPLFASPMVRIRHRVGAVADWLSGAGVGSAPLASMGDPGPGTGEDEFDELPGEGASTLRRLLAVPAVQLALAVGVVTLLAERRLVFAGGPLRGGALLAMPEGAGELWRTYLSAWHDVSVGSGDPAPPGIAALAALSTVLLGQPSYALDLLLLASVPVSAVTAYLAATRLVRHLYLRLWAAATWALLPAATGAVAAGRTGAAAVQIALPLLVLAGARVLSADPAEQGWWRVWALGLALAVLSAFSPPLWPLAGLLLLVGAGVSVLLVGRARQALAAVLVALVPALVLFPWSLHAALSPSAFFAGPQVADPALPGWHLALLSPGGPGAGPAWITLGLVVGGVLGTVREAFRGLALACWGVALSCLAVALAVARWRPDNQTSWPGTAVQLASLAVLVAAIVAANGARTQLAGRSFGWRQLLAAGAALAAALVPVLAAVSWIGRGADDPLERDPRPLLPPFAQEELASVPGLRALVLEGAGSGRLAYHLVAGGTSQVAATGVQAEDRQRALLDQVVADLASPRGSDAAEALSTRAVRFVALRVDGDERGAGRLATVLDGQVGLVRRSSGDVVLWQVSAPTARLSLLPPALAERAAAGDRAPTPALLRQAAPQPLRAERERARTPVPAGPKGRLLVLADAADDRWAATLDGQELRSRSAWGWAQAFELPTTGGTLELSYDQTARKASLAVQLVLVVLVLVLAAPVARRGRGLETSVAEDAADHREQRDVLVPVERLERITS